MSAVIADHLVKRYKSGKEIIEAVHDVSFAIEKGELFGIIGPDGAGKTSLFRMLTTLLLPDGGSASVDGSDILKDYKAIRNKVGYMPGRFSLYQDLTVEENLNFYATIFKTTVRENYGLISDIYKQIEPFKKRKAGKLSGGMKQKLALSCALIHKPVVLFLDEPTTGVDAVSRKEFWDMLFKLKEQNITILVSTPYMDEATLCDRIALMQHGELMTTGSPGEIIRSFNLPVLAITATDMYKLLKDLAMAPAVEHSYAFGEYHHAVVNKEYNEKELNTWLKDRGNKNVEIRTVKPAIEDCFMQLMLERNE
jgi:ABC-2 type transport system ATP-binding protein